MNNSNVTDWGKVRQLFEIEVSKLFKRNKAIEVIPEHFYDLFDKIQMYGTKFTAKSYSMTVVRLSCTYYADGSANFGEGKTHRYNLYFTNPDAEFQLMAEQLSNDEFYSTFHHNYIDLCDEPGDNYGGKTITQASIPVANFELCTGCIIKDGNSIISEYHLSDAEIDKMKIKYGGFEQHKQSVYTKTITAENIKQKVLELFEYTFGQRLFVDKLTAKVIKELPEFHTNFCEMEGIDSTMAENHIGYYKDIRIYEFLEDDLQNSTGPEPLGSGFFNWYDENKEDSQQCCGYIFDEDYTEALKLIYE